MPSIVPKVRRPIARERSGCCYHLGRVEPVPGLTLPHVGLTGGLLTTLPGCRCRPSTRPPSRRSVSPVGVSVVGLVSGVGRTIASGEPRRPFPRRGVSSLAMAFRSGGASRVSVGCLSCRRHGDGDGGTGGGLLNLCSVRRGIVTPPSNYLPPVCRSPVVRSVVSWVRLSPVVTGRLSQPVELYTV